MTRPPTPRLHLSELLCFALLLVLVAIPLGFPDLSRSRPSALTPATAPADIAPPGPSTLLPARHIVGVAELLRTTGQPLPSGLTDTLFSAAKSPEDNLRALIVERFLDGPATVDPQLETLAAQSPSLAPDIDLLLQQDPAGAALEPSSRPAAITADFREHHGWFADLALSQNLPATDPLRVKTLAAATRTTLTLSVFMIAALAACGLGLVLLVTLLVLRARRKLLPPHPAAPFPDNRRPYLEAFILYLASLILLPILLDRAHVPRNELIAFSLAAPLAVCLWPWIRGQSFTYIRRAGALNAGKGFFREIFAGIVGYLAGLPLLVVGAILAFILITLSHKDASHPIQNIISPDPRVYVPLLLLAAVYAPLFEELFFRGFFYTYLRSRTGHLVSALLSSLLFAAIHPQGWPAIPALAALAFTFATMREYRNSLLPSITAHALNNATVLTLLTLALS
jgi:membrane protease YdiL (CAAX protease family)